MSEPTDAIVATIEDLVTHKIISDQFEHIESIVHDNNIIFSIKGEVALSPEHQRHFTDILDVIRDNLTSIDLMKNHREIADIIFEYGCLDDVPEAWDMLDCNV